MTTADRLDRLEEMVARLETATPQDVVSPLASSPPAYVAPGELITSVWGNNVVNAIVSRVGAGAVSTGQTIGTGATPEISWNTEAYDTDGFFTAGNTRFTVPTGCDGIYVVTVQIGCTVNVSVTCDLNVFIGGNQRTAYLPAGKALVNLTTVGQLAAGQQVYATVYNGDPAPQWFAGDIQLLRVSF